jgi:putative transposase
MDEAYLAAAVRNVSLNPVRAGLVERAEQWRWSSVAAHLARKDDGLVRVAPVLDRYGDFRAFLAQDVDRDAKFANLRRSETTGRPLGDDKWIVGLEKATGRVLKPRKRGPKRRGDKGS